MFSTPPHSPPAQTLALRVPRACMYLCVYVCNTCFSVCRMRRLFICEHFSLASIDVIVVVIAGIRTTCCQHEMPSSSPHTHSGNILFMRLSFSVVIFCTYVQKEITLCTCVYVLVFVCSFVHIYPHLFHRRFCFACVCVCLALDIFLNSVDYKCAAFHLLFLKIFSVA